MNGKREYDLRDQERREQAANVRVGALCRVEKFDPAAMRVVCIAFHQQISENEGKHPVLHITLLSER